MVFKCSIPGCGNTNKTTKTHCLPKDPEIRRQWCEAVHRNDMVDVADSRQRYNFRICDVHFAENAKFVLNRNRTNLKYNAVPTLYLPSVVSAKDDLRSTPPSVAGSEDILEPVPDSEVMYSSPATNAPDELSTSVNVPSKCESTIARNESPVASTSNVSFEHSTPTKSYKESKVRKNLLKSVGVTRAANLTPKARKMYEMAKDLKNVARRLFSQNASNKERLIEALHYAESPDFSKAKLSERSLNFINCQLKMNFKNARGRRFTLEDKVFALSLLKQSPKAYRVLRSVFALPSRKTLMNILNKIHFSVGIIPQVMSTLKKSLDNMDVLDKHCVLMFDEISLDPGLTYDKRWDTVVGFEETNGDKKLKFADHGLVFMLRGLKKKWKQPVSFHFSQGGMNSSQLKVPIEKTILALQKIGFIIVCTVCDQYAANVNAIKALKEMSRSPNKTASDVDIFEIGGQEIVAVYDPPHLLKGIRNNLLAYDLKFTQDNIQKTASWKDIMQLYKLDEGDFNTRMCYKLTDAHVYREKLKKMKVKHAAQVFSHRVSSTLRWTAKYGRKDLLPTSAEETATFISFMDQTFDSVNGSTLHADHGKVLRCAVKDDSPHVAFWESAIKVFKTMKFITPKGEMTPPSVKNWIKTLRGFIYIWRKLKNSGFKYLSPRNINQDPLENFFGCIRSHGVRNINPNCYSFLASYKTLIINNFSSPHSPGANCEEDNGDILNSLKTLLTTVSSENIECEEPNVSSGSEIKQDFGNVDDPAIISTHSYIAGYIAKNLKKKIGNCSTCSNQLQAPTVMNEHSLICEREYREGSLIKTRTQFRRMFSNMVVLFLNNIGSQILHDNIKKKLTRIFKNKLFNPFLCINHNLFDMYIEHFLNFFMFSYFKNINSILKGRVTYNKKDKDVLKKMAWDRYLLLKCKNKKIKNIKQLA